MEVRAVEWKAADGRGWAQVARDQFPGAGVVYGLGDFELGGGFRLRDHLPVETSFLVDDGDSLTVVVGAVGEADVGDLRTLVADVFPDLQIASSENEDPCGLLAEVLARHDDDRLIFLGPEGRSWNLSRLRGCLPVFDADREHVALVPVTIAVLGRALLTVWHDIPASQTTHTALVDGRARNGRYTYELTEDITSVASRYIGALAQSYGETVLAATRHLDRWEASFVETVTADPALSALPTIAPGAPGVRKCGAAALCCLSRESAVSIPIAARRERTRRNPSRRLQLVHWSRLYRPQRRLPAGWCPVRAARMASAPPPPGKVRWQYMAGRELKALFRAYREGNELAFRRAASEIIEEEESKQHLALARDLRRIIAGGATAAIAEGVTLPPPPMDREGAWPLAEIRHFGRPIDDLVLSGKLLDRVRAVANEVARWSDLDRHGVPRRQRLLFYGPPGCGKTSAAEALAAEIGLPLLVVRLDAVVSSYLGETASNLHRIFDYAREGSWVILFDEFDSLGKARDDPSEHGEIKRVITAFLQMLDGFTGSSLLIAATNHERLLDPALWRRFDEVLEFPPPTVHQIRTLLRRRLRGVPHTGLNIELAAADLKGLPHAAVEKVAWDARRAAVLARRKRVTERDLRAAMEDVRARPW